MANGLAGDVEPAAFQTALNEVCVTLAKDIARDGEGATKLLEVVVFSARDDRQGKRVAKAVVNSPLMKAAVYGADPNWGRVAMAIGKCHEEDDIQPEKVSIAFGDTCVFAKGEPQNVDLHRLEDYLRGKEIRIAIDLGLRDGQATAWGCDLTEDYVRINALYPT
jgi:glutamate N-acetyltransferase/amino-acid N-acetyltransferase